VTTSNIVLHGVNGTPAIDSANLSYDAATNILTIPLLGSIQNDRLRLEIKDTLKSTAGAFLDGDWINNVQAFNSGDGVGGTSFQFRFNVLPGDATHSTVTDLLASPAPATDINDVSAVFGSLFTLAGNPGYSIFKDVNGSASIDINDVSAIFGKLFTTLPASLPGDLSAPLVASRLTTAADSSVTDIATLAAPTAYDLMPPEGGTFAENVDAVFDAPSVNLSENEEADLDSDLIDNLFSDPFEDILL
jgi:hypothetical protein